MFLELVVNGTLRMINVAYIVRIRPIAGSAEACSITVTESGGEVEVIVAQESYETLYNRLAGRNLVIGGAESAR